MSDDYAETLVATLLNQGTSSKSAAKNAVDSAQQALRENTVILDTTRRVHNAEQLRRLTRAKKVDTRVNAKRKRVAARKAGKTKVTMTWQQAQPLNALWRQYIGELIASAQASEKLVGEKLLSCDWHGAIVSVVRSKNVTVVGLSGIVLQETRLAFRVVSADDKVKLIPKLGTVFRVHGVRQWHVKLHGNQLCHRPAERSVRRLKTRPNIEL